MFIYYIYFFFFTWCNLYWLCTWRVILRRALLDLSCSDSAAISAETQVTDLRHGPFITGPRRHLQHTDECGAEKEMKSKRKRIVMTNETTRDWDDAPRGDTVLPPPSYTKGKWGVQMRLNAKLSADAASTEGQPHLFCTATWRSEKKIRRLGGGRAVGNVKVDFHLVRFSRTRNLSKGHASDCQTGAPYECVEYEMTALSAGWCLLQGGILSPV